MNFRRLDLKKWYQTHVQDVRSICTLLIPGFTLSLIRVDTGLIPRNPVFMRVCGELVSIGIKVVSSRVVWYQVVSPPFRGDTTDTTRYLTPADARQEMGECAARGRWLSGRAAGGRAVGGVWGPGGGCVSVLGWWAGSRERSVGQRKAGKEKPGTVAGSGGGVVVIGGGVVVGGAALRSKGSGGRGQ